MIEDERWDRAKDRYGVRLLKWQKICDALDKGKTRPPRPHRRCKVEIIKGESSSCESSEDRSEGDVSTEVSLGDNGYEST